MMIGISDIYIRGFSDWGVYAHTLFIDRWEESQEMNEWSKENSKDLVNHIKRKL